MKPIEKTFKAEKEILENFFKNRISFKGNGVFERARFYYSINTYEYSMDIVCYIMSNIKGILMYLDSLGEYEGKYIIEINIDGKESKCYEYFKISHMREEGLDCLDYKLFEVEPFNVVLFVGYEKFSKKIKSDECVMCLSNTPNVLFYQCGHLCICKECENKLEKERGKAKCPLCRKINRIIRVI